ncbi:hypothetical protein FACS189462_6030 [Spirochaetia bacterium]|nr:hypothetical protein FACS189462_6030 [Spirochaetia bacterium]
MARKKKQQQGPAGGRNRYDVDEYLDEKVSFANFKYCVTYISRVKGPMLLALTLSIVGSIVGLSGPLFIQRALDEAVPAKDYRLLFEMAAFLAGSIVIAIGFGTIRNLIVARAGQSIIHDIRYDLFAHLQKLPFSFYDSRPHGKIFVRVVPYVNSVSDALSNGILNFIIEILNILFIIFFMYKVDPHLATVTVLGANVPVLPVKGLGHLHAVDGFLHICGKVGILVRHDLPCPALPGLDGPDKQCQQREPQHGYGGKVGINLVHKKDDEEDVENFNDEVEDTV